MEVVRSGQEMTADVRRPQGTFLGDAEQRPLHEQLTPSPVRVSFVRFSEGARTGWHSHSGGQVLHATDGSGLAQNRGEAEVALAPGDTVTAAANQEHWHGAAPGATFTHLAVTIGDVTWEQAPG